MCQIPSIYCLFLMASAASSISSKQQTTSCRTLDWPRPNENCNWVWSWVIQQPFGLFSTIEFSFIWNIKTKQRSGNMADVAWVRGSEGAAGFTFIQSTCVGQQLQHSTYLPGPTFSTIEKWRLHQNLKKAEEAGCNVRKRKCSNSFVPVGQFWSELFWKRSGSGLHRTRWKTLLGRFCAKPCPFPSVIFSFRSDCLFNKWPRVTTGAMLRLVVIFIVVYSRFVYNWTTSSSDAPPVTLAASYIQHVMPRREGIH